ncbi:MAG TPA: ThuA domain-containing protein, partial [Planctomycetes bacterium]|nr:ThuA domain-containing protein [Planctomycetota bacterium]
MALTRGSKGRGRPAASISVGSRVMNRRQWLKTSGSALASLAAWPLRRTWAAARKPRVLYFTRSAGFEHPVVRRPESGLSHSERVLTEMGRRAGFEVVCTKDGRVFDEDLDRFDLIAFYTSGDLTRPNTRKNPPMTADGKRRLLEALHAGKGFVGFHAASDTFHSPGPRDQVQPPGERDPYIAMLGGEFLTHGAQQEASLIIASRFPGAGSLGCAEGISFTEEWYALKNFAPDLHVVLVQETQLMQGDCYRRPDYPCTWARMHGQGRVFYTSLGHREDVWTNPFFQTIVLGGLNWALG